MNYRMIDMDNFPRRAHFEYFRSLAYPYVGITANVDITDFLNAVKGRALPFYDTLCYCVTRAANSVPEFRQRICGDGIIEYEYCQSSHTVALPDGTYCYCSADSSLPFEEYLPDVLAKTELAKANASIKEEEDVDSYFFISCVPWISYTSVIQPTPLSCRLQPALQLGQIF